MPYAPQTQFDPALISAVGQNFTKPIGQALQTGIQNYKQIATEGKAADALRKAMYGPEDENGVPQNPAPFGITDEQWATMGSRDRSAAALGWTKAEALKQAMAETQHLQAEDQANQFYAKLGSSLSKQLDQAPTDYLTGEPMTGDPLVAAVKANITPQQQMLLRAVSEAGPGNRGAAAAVAPIVKAMLGAGGEGSGPDVTPKQITMPDGTVLNYQPNTKNPAFPSPSQKVDAATAAQERLLQWKLENGMGSGAVTDQDRFKFATQANLSRLKAAQEAMNNPFVTSNPDALTGAKAELQAAQQEQAQLLSSHPGAKPAKGKPADATAAYKSKAEMANALATQNPTWSRQQVIDYVNNNFTQ